MSKIAVFCVGNRLHLDDGVGPAAYDAVLERFDVPEGVDFGDTADTAGETMDTGGAIQLFTIRNMVNFLLGIGWGGVCFYSAIPNKVVLALVAILCGCLLVGAFLLMYRQLMRLESNGAFRIEDCVGTVCDVYLRIPGRADHV